MPYVVARFRNASGRSPDGSAIVDPILRMVSRDGVAGLVTDHTIRVDVRRAPAMVVGVSFENDLAVGKSAGYVVRAGASGSVDVGWTDRRSGTIGKKNGIVSRAKGLVTASSLDPEAVRAQDGRRRSSSSGRGDRVGADYAGPRVVRRGLKNRVCLPVKRGGEVIRGDLCTGAEVEGPPELEGVRLPVGRHRVVVATSGVIAPPPPRMRPGS